MLNFDRGPWTRGAGALALLLHLSLVGFLPMGEALHDHAHDPGVEWHTDGSHQHADESATACPIVFASTSPGLTSGSVSDAAATPACHAFVAPIPDRPQPADAYYGITARGPPSS